MEQTSVNLLLHAGAFPHKTGDITLIQTHISWVILTGDFAYKIKKPLDLGFLDFSTLAQREYFCNEEIQLNRRYAPEVYLGVVPISGPEDAPKIDGVGPVLDYAVKMRQFDTDSLLDSISKKAKLERHLVRAMAAELAKYHRDFPSAYGAAKNPAAMQAAMFQNFAQIREYPIDSAAAARLDSLEDWTRAQISELLPLMVERVRQGHIKDLHGDLHLGNMVLIGGKVRFFDCIEFNQNFRLMDTVAEIAFLAMDMADRGEAAQQVLNDYLEYSGDYAGLALLDLYRVYFAMVRAKVSLMREPISKQELQQTSAYQAVVRLTSLAGEFARDRPLFIALMHGVAGTGKSTVAAQVAQQFSAIRLRSDVERKRLFKLGPDESSESIDTNIYSPRATESTYEHLRTLSRTIIESGFPCIADATFLDHRVRKIFIDLADTLVVPVIILDCIASAQCIAERLRLRTRNKNDASEANIAIMQKQTIESDPLQAREKQYLLTVDTERPFDGQLITRHLQQQFDQCASPSTSVPPTGAQR